jgi:WD40 repeat protein
MKPWLKPHVAALLPVALALTASAAPIARPLLSVSFGTAWPNMSVRFSPDGRIVYAGVDTRIVAHDTASGKRVRVTECRDCYGGSFDLSPDGALMLVVSVNAAAAVLLDARTGSLVRKLEGSPPEFARFSPDGRLIAGASNGEVTVWDARSGKRVRDGLYPDNEARPVQELALSPDGRSLAAVVKGRVDRAVLMDVASGKRVWSAWPEDGSNRVPDPTQTLSGEYVPRRPPLTDASAVGVTFRPDGKAVAVDCSPCLSVPELDAATGKLLRRYGAAAQHAGDALAAYGADGRTVVTAVSEDLRVWDTATGRARRGGTLRLPLSAVAMRVSPDGRLLGVLRWALASDDQLVLEVWRLP